MRQLVDRMHEEMPSLLVATMTRYRPEHTFPVVSPPQSMNNVLAEYISCLGYKQMHIAETEKYAHVTFFLNGGREEPFPQEHRILIPSPKVATYDLEPEMSCRQVTGAVLASLADESTLLTVCNLAPPDMVGHTGVLKATIEAVKATDACLGAIYEYCKENNVILMITADHGNAEQMLDSQRKPHTAHTCNPVPLILVDKDHRLDPCFHASLSDVAPTLLTAMNLAVPPEMTGKSLLL